MWQCQLKIIYHLSEHWCFSVYELLFILIIVLNNCPIQLYHIINMIIFFFQLSWPPPYFLILGKGLSTILRGPRDHSWWYLANQTYGSTFRPVDAMIHSVGTRRTTLIILAGHKGFRVVLLELCWGSNLGSLTCKVCLLTQCTTLLAYECPESFINRRLDLKNWW